MRITQNRALNKRNGQALVELAVFGAVILTLFIWMLGFGQSLTASQTMSMYSFRQAEKLARHRSREHGFLGCVTFTTVASINPLNPLNTKASSSEASGSASVIWENELFAFAMAEEEDDVSEEDSPITYYQMGKTMIRAEEAIVWPTMTVKRKVENKYRTYKDGFFNVFAQIVKLINDIKSGGIFLDEEEYYSLESQPTWDTTKKIEESYQVGQDSAQSGKSINFNESSSAQARSTTTFKMLDKDRIKEWDDNIVDIVDMDKEGNVEVVQKQTIEADKQWQNFVD